MKENVTLGVVVGNRGFFPSHLCESGREAILKALAQEGLGAVALEPADTEYGSVESLSDAHKCARLFAAHREEIDGVVVTLPNFGDERGVANTLRFAGLSVPVLIQATPDDPARMSLQHRRDSFCGKMSLCNNLQQYGIPYSLTTLHTVDPASEGFHGDLRRFAAVCRVVRGMRRARFGMLGARPAAFNTVRFSEKLLERAGITVETLDLSEAFGRIARMADDDPPVRNKLDKLRAYADVSAVPASALTRIAKLGAMIDDWVRENEYEAVAIQCWTSMEQYFGVVPCTAMSMLSEALIPAACETDIVGAAAMFALALASGKPSAIVDWNNNYGDDPDKAVAFHCSNLPRCVFAAGKATVRCQEIIAGDVGQENAWGAVCGRIRAGPFTYLRIATDDFAGKIRAYVGEGEFTDDPLETFGGYGVVRVPGLQRLLRHICEHGYEHHVAMSLSTVGEAAAEALENYLGWDVYRHSG